MTRELNHGVSIVELLVALAIMVTVSAALLPAIALASRLQRDSANETEAAVIAAARLEALKATPGRGEGHDFFDRDGFATTGERAAYECRWRIDTAPGAAGALRIVVHAAAVGERAEVVAATVVPDG
jgi:type II secretory pathway pseudopilin PulG